MSPRDRSRLPIAAKVAFGIALFAAVVVVGCAIRDWEHHRIAEIVVERLRSGGR